MTLLRIMTPLTAGRKRSTALALAPLLALATCTPPPSQTTDGAESVVEIPANRSPGPVEASSFTQARESGEAHLTFFMVPATGFALAEASGLPTGVTADLLRNFANWLAETHSLQLQVEWVEEEQWADFYGYVRDSRGGVFGVGNVTITEARAEELDFSPPYLQNVAVLVTHESIPELTALEEVGEAFRHLTALPYPGTLHEERLHSLGERYFSGMRTRPVASNDELVELLASESGYFGYIDIYNYHRARERGLPLRRHPVGDDAAETFGVIMPHDSDWTPVLEDFFRAEGGYVSGTRHRELMARHLGADLAAILLEAPGSVGK